MNPSVYLHTAICPREQSASCLSRTAGCAPRSALCAPLPVQKMGSGQLSTRVSRAPRMKPMAIFISALSSLAGSALDTEAACRWGSR